jgi:tripeptidyl-peptidase I
MCLPNGKGQADAPKYVTKLQIGLKQSCFDEVETSIEGKGIMLYNWYLVIDRPCPTVSSRSYKRDGQHPSSYDVNDLIKPANSTLQLVHGWPFDQGIDTKKLEYSAAKDWVISHFMSRKLNACSTPNSLSTDTRTVLT